MSKNLEYRVEELAHHVYGPAEIKGSQVPELVNTFDFQELQLLTQAGLSGWTLCTAFDKGMRVRYYFFREKKDG